MTTHRPSGPGRRLLSALLALLLAAVVGACGSGPTTADDPRPEPPTEPPTGLTAEQLSDLAPSKTEVAALTGMPEGLRAGPNDGLSQVLEGLEVPETLEYRGHAYSHSTGNPTKGGEFESVGLLSMLDSEPEVAELFRLLTHEGLELPRDERWDEVEVDGATEAAHAFVEVRSQGFVIDTTVARRGRLLLFITLLSSKGGSRPEVGVRVAELVLQEAADLER